MKLDMMVVGIKSITEELMEIEMVPVITKNKKITIADVAGDFDKNAKELVDLFLQDKQYRSKMYITREWCSNNMIMPFMHMTLNIDVGDISRYRLEQ